MPVEPVGTSSTMACRRSLIFPALFSTVSSSLFRTARPAES
jgi:hypothetical protein